MARRWIWIGLGGVLVALLSLGLGSARAAGPLEPMLTVSGLPPMQTTAAAALQPLNQLSREHAQRVVTRAHDDDAVAGFGEFDQFVAAGVAFGEGHG